MHVLDDADDADGLALVVVEGLADQVSCPWEQRLGECPGSRWPTGGYPGTSFLPVLDVVGIEVLPADEFDAQRLHAVFVGAKVLAGEFSPFLSGSE